MEGLIHIYCGDGKGKTTAATGLAVRAAGAGKRVLFTQFFKNGNSCEVKSLKLLPLVRTLHCKTVPGRFKNMSPEEQAHARSDYSALLRQAMEEAQNAELLVLDEVISACNHGIIDESILREFLQNKADGLEVVLTGRNPSEELITLADYVSEIKKVKHPFDKGIRARRGIEF